MNQIHQTQTFASATKNSDAPQEPGTELRLTTGDARALHAMLVQGNDALARRKDLGDMYKRIVATLTTLDTGLTERQEARADSDRALLSARLESMETAINSVEGVLRIELEPLVRAAVDEAVAGQLGEARPRGRTRALGRRALQLAALCGVLYTGAVFSGEIKDFTRDAGETIFGLAAAAGAILSPDGGIGAAPNQVE
jgi:hypothetical protein